MQHFTHTLLIIIVLTFASCVNSETDSQSTPPPSTKKVTTPKLTEREPQPVKDTLVAKPIKPELPVTPPPAKPPKKIVKAKQPPKTPPPPPPKANPLSQSASKVVSAPPPVVSKPTTPPPPPVKQAGVLRFENKTLNYGYIKQGKVIDHVFKFTNVSNVPVNILNAEASCGCTRPTYSFMPIEPGATGEIGVRFDSNGKLGKMESSVTVLTDAKPAKHHLYLLGTITDPPKKEKKEEKKEKEEEKDNKEGSQDVKEKEPKQEEKTERKPFRGRKLPKGTLPGSNKKDDDEGQ